MPVGAAAGSENNIMLPSSQIITIKSIKFNWYTIMQLSPSITIVLNITGKLHKIHAWSLKKGDY